MPARKTKSKKQTTFKRIVFPYWFDNQHKKIMKNLKVVKIEDNKLVFNNGTSLSSKHEEEDSERHYLDFEELDISDFAGLEFDLTNDDFFNRVKDYGIELKPTQGHVVRVCGYGLNNGYYNSSIDLIISDPQGKTVKIYDVSECQKWGES